MVGWSLLTDFDAIKRAGVPILRSLNIRFRLKQQARKQGIFAGILSLAHAAGWEFSGSPIMVISKLWH